MGSGWAGPSAHGRGQSRQAEFAVEFAAIFTPVGIAAAAAAATTAAARSKWYTVEWASSTWGGMGFLREQSNFTDNGRASRFVVDGRFSNTLNTFCAKCLRFKQIFAHVGLTVSAFQR